MISKLRTICVLILCCFVVRHCIKGAPIKVCAQDDYTCRMNAYLDRLLDENRQKLLVQQMHQTSTLDSDLSWHPDFTMDVKCFACQESVDMVRILFRHGEKSRAIQTFLTYMCNLLHIETDRICRSIIPLFSDEVLYVFERIVLSPEQICSLLLNDCGSWYDPLHWWNVTLPDVPKPPIVVPQRPPAGAPVTRVLQISDIHFDARYSPGAWVVCNEPLCCRQESNRSGSSDLRAGHWGAYGACDVPYWTVENMLQHIVSQHSFDYVYWTGDLPPHDVWQQTRSDQVDIYKNITSLFLKYFPNKPVFSALGNHESAPVDSFPPVFITGNRSTAWLYDELELSWTHWLNKTETSANIKYGAYYTMLISPGLRLISVNSNYCNNLNVWLLLNATDPNGELRWLAETLQKAEDAGEKVHIIGHIPPGHSDCLRTWSANYYKIVNRYENTIAAQFYGHTHNDHFQMYYDDGDAGTYRQGSVCPQSDKKVRRPVGSVFISPSVTTFLDIDPGFRIYTIDGSRMNSTRMVLDHENYILNLTRANTDAKHPKWQLLYSARQAFGLKSLFPNDLEELITTLETDDELWQRFLKFYYKGRPQACDFRCKQDMLCSLRTGRQGDTSFC